MGAETRSEDPNRYVPTHLRKQPTLDGEVLGENIPKTPEQLHEEKIRERIRELHIKFPKEQYPRVRIFRDTDRFMVPDKETGHPTPASALHPFAAQAESPRDDRSEQKGDPFRLLTRMDVNHREVGRITPSGKQRADEVKWFYLPGKIVWLENVAPPMEFPEEPSGIHPSLEAAADGD